MVTHVETELKSARHLLELPTQVAGMAEGIESAHQKIVLMEKEFGKTSMGVMSKTMKKHVLGNQP